MKIFKTLCGNSKWTMIVRMNGVTGLAKDDKPTGELKSIVEGEDKETGVKSYYLVMVTEAGTRIYATQVEREVYNLMDFWKDVVGSYDGEPETPIMIRCSEELSRISGKKFFKIAIESF